MKYLKTFKALTLSVALTAMSLVGIPTDGMAKSKFVFANSSPYDTLDPHVIYDVGRVASRLTCMMG